MEVLRLQRQKSDLELKLTDVRSQYYVQAREALSKANAEVDMVSAILKGRQDSVTRLTVKSPVRGIVKNIKVTTIGGGNPAQRRADGDCASGRSPADRNPPLAA
ncbi:hypothetical protein OIPHN260_36810 [Enterobacter roggenkampii]|uniref:Uncharacterized protein n=1 Tax=Enterobacter roggenkampii TaxID=1812935 RepID=A0AAU9BT01_9ENTR|nr:hypothetical protein OIPHN260_36810 [Enterobacter roggenkampii]